MSEEAVGVIENGSVASSGLTWRDLLNAVQQSESLQKTITSFKNKLQSLNKDVSNMEQALSFFLEDSINLSRFLKGCKYDLDKCIKKMRKTLEFYLDYPTWIFDMIPLNINERVDGDEMNTSMSESDNVFTGIGGDGNTDSDNTGTYIGSTSQRYGQLLQQCDLYDKIKGLDSLIFQMQYVDHNNNILYIFKIKRYLDFISSLPSDQANECYHEQLLLRLNLWFFHQISFDSRVQEHGAVLIGSFGELSMWDSMKIPQIAPLQERKSMFLFLQNCIPLRVGGFWIFEEPFYVRWLFSIISLVMKDKFKSRFHLCGSDYSTFCEYLGQKDERPLTRDDLPICLGGQQIDATIDVVETYLKHIASL